MEAAAAIVMLVVWAGLVVGFYWLVYKFARFIWLSVRKLEASKQD